jgi:hypothetical protein
MSLNAIPLDLHLLKKEKTLFISESLYHEHDSGIRLQGSLLEKVNLI